MAKYRVIKYGTHYYIQRRTWFWFWRHWEYFEKIVDDEVKYTDIFECAEYYGSGCQAIEMMKKCAELDKKMRECIVNNKRDVIETLTVK